MPDVNLNVKTRGTKQAESSFQKIGKSLATMATAAIAAREGMKLLQRAGKLEGVENAFRRTGKNLEDLRRATRGTISDFDLMQKSVIATTLGVDNLETLFKFASIRARETGQSVDYLIGSIVEGIGKQSTMILDNLGLSVTRIRKEFKKTGDFAGAVAKIVNEDMAGMDVNIGQIADATDRWSVAFENTYDKAAKLIGLLVSKGESAVGPGAGRGLSGLGSLFDAIGRGIEYIQDAMTTQWQRGTLTEAMYKDVEILVEEMDEFGNYIGEANAGLEKQQQNMKDTVDVVYEYAEAMAKLDIVGFQKNIDKPIDRLPIVRAFEEVDKIAGPVFKNILDDSVMIVAHWDRIGQQMVNTFDYVFTETLIRQQNFGDAMVAGLESMLSRMAASIMARAGVLGLFSIFGGGGLLTQGAGILNFITGGLFSHDGAGLSPGGGGGGVTINMPNAAIIDSKTVRTLRQTLSRYDRLH